MTFMWILKKSFYQQTSGCRAEGAGVHRKGFLWSGLAAGRPARTPPSRCVRLGPSATVCRSAARKILQSGPLARRPRRKRRSRLRELVDRRMRTSSMSRTSKTKKLLWSECANVILRFAKRTMCRHTIMKTVVLFCVSWDIKPHWSGYCS